MSTRRFSTQEWIFLAVALLVTLAFVPGTAALGRLTSTAYSVIPVALLGLAAYFFYRWWTAEEGSAFSRPTACPGCGTQVAEHWRVCPMCARNLAEERVFCRYCAEPMQATWKVCPACSRPAPVT